MDRRRAWRAVSASRSLSSSEYEWVDEHLSRLGLRDRFAHLACYSENLAAKPAPDSYLEACARLGVRPGEAIALEDSPHGVDAARAAGLRVVAVPNAVTEQMDLSAADLVITSLAECSLADVLDSVRCLGRRHLVQQRPPQGPLPCHW